MSNYKANSEDSVLCLVESDHSGRMSALEWHDLAVEVNQRGERSQQQTQDTQTELTRDFGSSD